MKRIRSYTELSFFVTFEERYEYLAIRSRVGAATFGGERFLNQGFYTSREWKRVRNLVIDRDNGCDLGVPGEVIHERPIVHHMNPITIQDIDDANPDILDPDFLILTTHRTHNAIHYGDASLLRQPMIERYPGDTQEWAPIGGRRDAYR
jgi:hypothetical protein